MSHQPQKHSFFRRFFFLLALASLIPIPLAFADGDSRAATPAEKQFYKSVQSVLAKAVPAGPQGWETSDGGQLQDLDRVTPGIEKGSLRVDYRIGWQDTKRINEAQNATVQELAQHSGLDPEYVALTKQYNKLADDYGKALAKKNNAEASRIYQEMEAVGQKMQAINDRRDKEMAEIQAKLEPHDVKAQISISANAFYEGIYQKQFKPAPAVAGCLTYRSESEHTSNNGWTEGTTYVFLGKNWKLDRSAGTYMNYKPNKALPHTAVQAIIVKVQADPNRAQQLIKAIDWDSLKKLIKN